MEKMKWYHPLYNVLVENHTPPGNSCLCQQSQEIRYEEKVPSCDI